MSFDIFVQGFRDGASREADADALRAALAPYLVRTELGWNLRAGRSTAEIHGVEHLPTGFMITHVDGDELYDVIVHVAAACDLVIVPVGVAAAITREQQRDHLPEVLRGAAVLVTSGADLRAVIVSL